MDSPQSFASLQISEDSTIADLCNGENGIVLVFLPDTTGISSKLQLKDLRNNIHKIKSSGWCVVAITSQSEEKLTSQAEDLSLSFPIIHDQDNVIAKQFNTLGRTFSNPHISERTKRRTYILNESYEIIHVIDDIHPGNHTMDILQLIGQTQIAKSE